MITLAKALKIKNRLAGQLATLQQTARQYNTVQSDQTSSVDIDKIWTDLKATSDKLIDLKGKIGVATGKISPLLAELAERKNELSFISTINVREDKSELPVGYGNAVTVRIITFKNKVNLAEKQEMQTAIQTRIEELQDEVDEFNAKTKIEF